MKKIKIIVQKIVLLLGVGMFMYGLFNFSAAKFNGVAGCHERQSFWDDEIKFDKDWPTCPMVRPISTYYYYDQNSLILLTAGSVLIVLGLLKKREKETLSKK
jgi:hypothetical protein